MKLYRCYDNRLQPIERSPVLYGVELQPTRRRCETKNGSCNNVLDISDKSERFSDTSVLPFGHLPQCEDIKEWLWMFSGQIKIISTEYHDGIHYAKLPEHFFPIIDHLEQLHENGYVHGDIRAYNMVLKYPKRENIYRGQLLEKLDGQIYLYSMVLDFLGCQKSEGWLIDFDFGGKMSTVIPSAESTTSISTKNPIYPKGYEDSLPDGLRRGKEGESIEYDHDWYALGRVILDSHELRYSGDIKQIDLLRIYFDLKDVGHEKFGYTSDMSLLEGGPANFLRNHLQLAAKHGFYFRPESRFAFSLKKVYPRTGTTGSSRK